MSITRVHYRERQRLTAADLRFEQEYRLGAGGRHHLAPHHWGVVRGLRLVELRTGVFKLTPGVAIDGYGREILVPAAIEIEIENFIAEGCWFLLLHYCEDPEQFPPGRQCKDEPAPRIRQRTAWRLTTSFVPPPVTADGLAGAYAAGRMADLPPWPVLVATIGKGCNLQPGGAPPLIDYSRTVYASQRASASRSPTAVALMQIGLAGRMDVYHFLVSTRSAAQVFAKRVGIDPDRRLHVWRSLIIAGTQAYGEVALGHGLKMQITTPLPAGIGRRVQISGTYDAELRNISASLIDLGAAVPDQLPVQQGSVALTKTSAVLAFGAKRNASFHLLDVAKLQPIKFADARRRLSRAQRRLARRLTVATEPEHGDIAFKAELKPVGGKLALREVKPSAAQEDVACGEVDRTRGATKEPDTPVLQFKPAGEIETEPFARDIYAITTSAPTDAVPQTALRICGGAADDSDTSSRIGFGRQINGAFQAAIRIDGGGRLNILAAPGAPPDEPQLEVLDTVYLPPIGKNDPLLQDLLTLAFMGGLRRIGHVTTSSQLELKLSVGEDFSTPVVRDASFAYQLKISGSGGSIMRTIELITGPGGAGEMSFRALGVVNPALPATVQVEIPRFSRAEGAVEIVVLMLVEIGNLKRVAVSNSLSVDLTDA
jgi:hypothetical protein